MVYQPGIITGPLSGRAGNFAASSNASGTNLSIIRPHRKRLNSNLQAARSQFSVIAKAYGQLSDSDLLNWIALGAELFATGRLGRTYDLSGSNAYQYINQNLGAVGLPYVTSAPSFETATSINAVTVTAVGQTLLPPVLSITVDPSPLDTNSYLAIYGYRARRHTTMKISRKSCKNIDHQPPSSSSPYVETTNYLNWFPTFFAGQRVAVLCRIITPNGFSSPPFFASAVAT